MADVQPHTDPADRAEGEITGEATVYGSLMSLLLGSNVRAGIGARVWLETPYCKGWFEVVSRELGDTPDDTVYQLRLIDASSDLVVNP